MWTVTDQAHSETNNTWHPVNYRISGVYSLLEMQSKLNKRFKEKTLSVFRYPNGSIISYRDALKLFEDDTSSVQLDFKKADFSGKHMSESVSEHFVFLKAYESTTQRINLIGFLVAGGNFTFRISDRESRNYVLGDPYVDKHTNRFKYKKIMLPKRCYGFQLYNGKFTTNEVTLNAFKK
jgi:hypothetical protein